MKFYRICLFLMLQSLLANACLSAHQYKIFPIGIQNKQIVTLTAHIHRFDFIDKTEEFKIPKIGWSIEYNITIYSLKGKLLSKSKTEKLIIESEHYGKKLSQIYQQKIKELLSKDKSITLCTPEYISYCDFQKKCQKLSLESDVKNKRDYLIYKAKKYPVDLNTFQEYKRSATFTDDLSAYYLSSTRVFKANNIEIVIGHAGTGHEISMGYITNDPNKKPKDEYDVVILAKEHKPDIKFNKIRETIYEEPLLHHGYGFDFLILKETK